MLFGERHIRRTVLTMAGSRGEALAIVLYVDGTYGITADGEPVAGCHWPATGLDACIAQLLRFVGPSPQRPPDDVSPPRAALAEDGDASGGTALPPGQPQ